MPHPTSGRPDLSLPMHAFGAFHQAVLGYRQLLMRGMAEHGLHPGQAFAVGEISHREGITQAELAESLGVSRPTVERDWRFAKAWLVEEISSMTAEDGAAT